MSSNPITLGAASAEASVEQGDELSLVELLRVVQRRWRIALLVLSATMLTSAVNTFWTRTFNPTFQGGFKLLVLDPINTEGESQGEGGEIASVAMRSGGKTNTATLVEVLTSPLLLDPLERKLNLSPGSLAGKISVVPSGGGREGGAGVLIVNLLWSDPTEGQQILEKISQDYLAYSLLQRQEKLNQGLEFLDQQAPDLQQRVNSLQNKVASFRLANGFVEPQEKAGSILMQKQALFVQLKQKQLDYARLKARASSVSSGKIETASSATPSVSSGGLEDSASAQTPASLPEIAATIESRNRPAQAIGKSTGAPPMQDLFGLETALAEAEANYTESSPQVQELRAKRDRLRPVLQRRQLGEIQSELAQNLTEQQELRRQLDQLSRGFADNPQQIKQYDILQQELQVARDNLSSYIQARESFRLQVAQRTKPWRILSPPAFGQVPVAPSVSRNLAVSLMLGSMAGLGMAFLIDKLDHVFRSPRELKESLALPMLGVLPYLSRENNQTISSAIAELGAGERFAIKESLRNLFANYRMLRADKALRLVAITSSTQGEGKTTTTALFAQTLSQLGQLVLLVDADMRRPMLHLYLGVDNTEGFSSLLTDGSVSLKSTIKNVSPGLDLITAGPMPPDTTRLLSSQRCSALVDEIRALENYDLVLFDTPPALLLSDPVLLAAHLDGLMFVVGLEKVNRDLPSQALQRLMGTGLDVLGMVANQPLRRSASTSTGYDGYGDYGAYSEVSMRQVAADELSGAARTIAPALSLSANNQQEAPRHQGWLPLVDGKSSSTWTSTLWLRARKVISMLKQRD